MISKYFSTWLALYFFIWFLGYIFNINIIIEYINPYYTSILILIGFIITTIYYIFVKKYKYDYSFFVIILLIHILPIILSYYLIKNKHKYALINLIIISILYIFYMNIIKKDIFYTYFIEKPPTNWDMYFKMCKSDEWKYIPYCFLFKNT